jgi:hypothetical protein
MELLAVGAPLDLVRRCHQAAMDEIDHARLCLDLAYALDGVPHALGELVALPPRVLDIAGLCRTTFDEAYVPETFAAATAAAAAESCVDRQVREHLELLAQQEAEHAALARDIVAWCVQEQPDLRESLTNARIEPPPALLGRVGGAGMLTPETLYAVEAAALERVRTDVKHLTYGS